MRHADTAGNFLRPGYAGDKLIAHKKVKSEREILLKMATENPGWVYSCIQGTLKDLDHHVARSTVARVLNENGIPPAPGLPSSWCTFLRAHWTAPLQGMASTLRRTAGSPRTR